MADSLAPKHFNGEQNAELWLADLENYAAYKKSEVKRVLPLLLDDNIKTWYQYLSAEIKNDDKKLSEEFLKRYKKTEADILDLKCTLTNMRQGNRSIAAYFADFYKIANVVNMTEDEKITLARRQLNPLYSSQLCFQEHKTMESLEKAALQLERIHNGPAVTANTNSPQSAQPNLETLMAAMSTSLAEAVKTAVHTSMNAVTSMNRVGWADQPKDFNRGRSPNRHYYDNSRDRDQRDRDYRDRDHRDYRDRDQRSPAPKDRNRRPPSRSPSASRGMWNQLLKDVISCSKSYGSFKHNCRKASLCFLCGEYRSEFSAKNHTNECKAKQSDSACRACSKKGHFQKVCPDIFSSK